jgi:hypothetical protein
MSESELIQSVGDDDMGQNIVSKLFSYKFSFTSSISSTPI